MTRSIILITILALIAPAFAAALDLTPELEFRLQRLAEQRVTEALRDRAHEATHPGKQVKISGSAVLDENHVQVDVYFVRTEGQAPVENSDERFLYTVDQDLIQSLGRPTGEVAILPHGRNAELKARADALARFSQLHSGQVPGTPDGTQPMVKDCRHEPSGQITVVCESFGGIAAIWMGDAIRYTYTRDGIFVAQASL